jgi:hypothetical protein
LDGFIAGLAPFIGGHVAPTAEEWGVFRTLERLSFGPVVLVRAQKTAIK